MARAPVPALYGAVECPRHHVLYGARVREDGRPLRANVKLTGLPTASGPPGLPVTRRPDMNDVILQPWWRGRRPGNAGEYSSDRSRAGYPNGQNRNQNETEDLSLQICIRLRRTPTPQRNSPYGWPPPVSGPYGARLMCSSMGLLVSTVVTVSRLPLEQTSTVRAPCAALGRGGVRVGPGWPPPG